MMYSYYLLSLLSYNMCILISMIRFEIPKSKKNYTLVLLRLKMDLSKNNTPDFSKQGNITDNHLLSR